MSRGVRRALWGAIVVLFLARHDVWWWDDPTLVAGVPVGLAYHLAICIAASIVFAALTRSTPDGATGEASGARPDGSP